MNDINTSIATPPVSSSNKKSLKPLFISFAIGVLTGFIATSTVFLAFRRPQVVNVAALDQIEARRALLEREIAIQKADLRALSLEELVNRANQALGHDITAPKEPTQ